MSEPVQSISKLVRPIIVAALLMNFHAVQGAGDPEAWRSEWSATDFSKHTVSLAENKSGGSSKNAASAGSRISGVSPRATTNSPETTFPAQSRRCRGLLAVT
jgi:hypothetical protein